MPANEIPKDRGGPRWGAKYAYGFPIGGIVSGRFAYPLKYTTKTTKTIKESRKMNDICSDANYRYTSRSTKFAPSTQKLGWDEATDQVAAGRPDPSIPTNKEGRCADAPGDPVDFSFPCPSARSDKVRAVGEIRPASANRYCFINTPIRLHLWDLAPSVALSLDLVRTNWAVGITDQPQTTRARRLFAEAGHMRPYR